MQERYILEPENMSLNEKLQKLALKLLFSVDPAEKELAQQEWGQKGYEKYYIHLIKPPIDSDSINKIWNEKAENRITSYKVRPVIIHDEKVNQMLDAHLNDLTNKQSCEREDKLQKVRTLMAARIFANHMNYDIICLQEADYLDASLFLENYDVLFAETEHSKNGIAWNKNRFELRESIGDILGRAFALSFLDKESGKTCIIASCHLTGCNPYQIEKNVETGISDAAKGDCELQAVIDLLNQQTADVMIIGMDSNVTSLHPRLNLLKNAQYKIDYENYLEPTCTNPYQVLNTRIDWIALKSPLNTTITNIPVLSVGLNSMQTNISDHKPIAAKIQY